MVLRLNLLQSITAAGEGVNEDLFGCNREAAWVLDGATAIGPSLIKGAASDPSWLVEKFDQALRDVWRKDLPTVEIFESVTRSLAAQFDDCVEDKATAMLDKPTACLLMVRLWRDGLECSSVGDCWLIHRRHRNVSDFGHKIGDIALPVHQELARLHAAGVRGRELLDRLQTVEKKVRGLANIDGGYAILDLSLRWPQRMTRKTLAPQAGDELLLMTDGFYRLIDTFQRFNAETLIEAAASQGLETLLRDLRLLEGKDDGGSARLRGKRSDDVAAAFITIENDR